MSNTIHAIDNPDPNAGGACHVYEIRDPNGVVLNVVRFQHGPIKEVGHNGVAERDLLEILQHRLDSFQRGAFASPINEVTAGFVGAALASTDTRTRRRVAAGVEGTNAKAIGVEL